MFKYNNICIIVDDIFVKTKSLMFLTIQYIVKCKTNIYKKPDNDPNNNDNNGGTSIYKTELNLENKQEKSRPNSNEFRRLLSGGALVT